MKHKEKPEIQYSLIKYRQITEILGQFILIEFMKLLKWIGDYSDKYINFNTLLKFSEVRYFVFLVGNKYNIMNYKDFHIQVTIDFNKLNHSNKITRTEISF